MKIYFEVIENIPLVHIEDDKCLFSFFANRIDVNQWQNFCEDLEKYYFI